MLSSALKPANPERIQLLCSFPSSIHALLRAREASLLADENDLERNALLDPM